MRAGKRTGADPLQDAILVLAGGECTDLELGVDIRAANAFEFAGDEPCLDCGRTRKGHPAHAAPEAHGFRAVVQWRVRWSFGGARLEAHAPADDELLETVRAWVASPTVTIEGVRRV